MKAITVKQPWAWAIAAGLKDVENRTRPSPWRTASGQRVAIHAGQSIDGEGVLRVAELVRRQRGGPVPEQPIDPSVRGAIIATAVLRDVHTCTALRPCSPWGERGTWHLTLRDVVALDEPVPARGALGLWTLPADVERLVLGRTAVTA